MGGENRISSKFKNIILSWISQLPFPLFLGFHLQLNISILEWLAFSLWCIYEHFLCPLSTACISFFPLPYTQNFFCTFNYLYIDKSKLDLTFIRAFNKYPSFPIIFSHLSSTPNPELKWKFRWLFLRFYNFFGLLVSNKIAITLKETYVWRFWIEKIIKIATKIGYCGAFGRLLAKNNELLTNNGKVFL